LKIPSVYRIILISVFTVISPAEPVLTQGVNSLSGQAGTDTVIINSVNSPPETSGDALVYYIDYKKINEWAATNRTEAMPDSPPVTDGTAFFIVKPRIEIPVKGIEKGAVYRLYIDFVRYSRPFKTANSMLRISIKDIYGNTQHIASINETFFLSGEIFETEIPFNLSNPGSFTIIIQEYSDRPGQWGIWDIIVSSKGVDEIRDTGQGNPSDSMKFGPKIFQ